MDALFRVDGKVAVVTGGASGLGRAAAEMLATAGARVAVLDKQETSVGDYAVQADVADERCLESAFVSILGRWNWWMPPWAARILRVEPSMPAPERRGSVPLGLEPADPTPSVASGLNPTPAIEAK